MEGAGFAHVQAVLALLCRALGFVTQLLLLFLLQECTNLFSKGGGEELAKHAGVPFLGEWPLEQSSL